MTWTPNPLRKYELCAYMHGIAVQIGGESKVFPHFIWAAERGPMEYRGPDIAIESLARVSALASNSADLVFVCAEKLATDMLMEAWRIVKQGGCLALYSPQVSLDTMMQASGWDWIENLKFEEGRFQVFRRTGKRGQAESWTQPPPEKTCAILRLGAFGDMVQTSSLFPWLKAQGYHLTLICQSAGYEVVRNDPHVDRFIVHGREEPPNYLLPEYTRYIAKKYDKFVNLCESVEGTLLPSHNHVAHGWPNALRAKYLDRNYVEWTHELAEVPPPYQPKFYATIDEKAWARKKANQWGRRNILWSLAGSAGHKVWPHLDAIIARIMLEMPDMHVVLVGDDVCKILEIGWAKEPRVHCQSGEWTIRETMAFTEVADLVIGGETGVLNAAGCSDVPKIVTMSHSSEEMLTKWWENTITLRQPKGVGCPKQPCRQLHGNWDFCMKDEKTGTAVCQSSIDVEMMWDAVVSVMKSEHRKVA